MNKQIIRQGDVLLVPVEAIPEAATPVKATARGLVLAEGEVTGHAHVMAPDVVSMWDAAGQRYVRVEAATDLRHTLPSGGQADHNPITVEPGEYEVRIQREYHPEELRQVVD